MSTDVLEPIEELERVPFFLTNCRTSTDDDTWVVPEPTSERQLFTTELEGGMDVVIHVVSTGAKGIESALTSFAAQVAGIPQVEAVAHSIDGDVHLVWTYIKERDKDVRRRIYTLELELMEQYPGISFDFNVVALARVEGQPLLPQDLQSRIVFYRSRSDDGSHSDGE